MNAKVARGSDQFMLRLPDGMRDRIKVAAENNSRSMNAEIVATLAEKYPAPTPEAVERVVVAVRRYLEEGASPHTPQAMIDELKSAIDAYDREQGSNDPDPQ